MGSLPSRDTRPAQAGRLEKTKPIQSQSKPNFAPGSIPGGILKLSLGMAKLREQRNHPQILWI